MKRLLSGLAAVFMAVSVAAVGRPVGAADAMVSPAAVPTHAVEVTGQGVATYPDFDPSVARYGVTTTSATNGTVTVQATSSDPGASFVVNGRPAPGGTGTVTGLAPGDEVAVFVQDSGGVARYAFIYLPPEFPTIERVTPVPAAGALAPGQVLLTLALWINPSPFFETAVDANGVPSFVRQVSRAMDLSPQPNGRISVFEPTTTPGRTGLDLIELDPQWREVARHRTVDLVDTDGHDAIVLPDGTVWLMAYEPNADTGLVDAVIQRVDPDGTVGFEWSSKDHVADSVTDQAAQPSMRDDYAHINSFEVMDDGDLLVSFRHFSSVWKIATHAHDGFDVGDVVWKLGGRFSDFDFADGDLGPCAQHTAHQLPNGNILMYDNGSWSASTAMCVDPADPTGAPVERIQTRVVEYELDEGAGTAEVVSSYAPSFWFAIFAGSVQPLPNGNRLIGWAAERRAIASEIDADGNLLWEIKDPGASAYFTYRAFKAVVPDAIAPTVDVQVPAQGATYVEGDQVPASYECSDRGGSSLQSCSATNLDTATPGVRSMSVTATDGAGRTTTVTRQYTVRAASLPDVMARTKGHRTFTGDGVAGGRQKVRSDLARPGRRATLVVRLRNDGGRPDRLAWTATGGGPFRLLRPRSGTTPLLQPGETWTVRVRVLRTASVPDGRTGKVSVQARSTTSGRRDALTWRLRAT